ncbi:ML domain-containing protein [Aspergillus novoparasiticus]|uniref:Phosphatidylglycerol/phosphatidylinositol transfer protein n=1 Tax=Aspergillus novoparasiticus TaxID=986946 RepID=A0A5N6ECY6_9EURO|nr:ML domain-containing protein [Aspergillus novoparasiticus]
MMYFSFPFFALLASSIAFQFPITSPYFHISNDWSYENCGSPDDAVDIRRISLNPDPPSAGKSLEVKLMMNVYNAIEEGSYVDVVVKLGLIKLLKKEFDACETLRNYNSTIQCPVAPGSYEVTHTVDLPREIPLAKYNIEAEGYTNNDHPMLCLKVIADFRFPPK